MRIPKKRRFALANPIVPAEKLQKIKHIIRRRKVLEYATKSNNGNLAVHLHHKDTAATSIPHEEENPHQSIEQLDEEIKSLNQKKLRLFLLLKQVMAEDKKRKRAEEEIRLRKSQEKAFKTELEEFHRHFPQKGETVRHRPGYAYPSSVHLAPLRNALGFGFGKKPIRRGTFSTSLRDTAPPFAAEKEYKLSNKKKGKKKTVADRRNSGTRSSGRLSAATTSKENDDDDEEENDKVESDVTNKQEANNNGSSPSSLNPSPSPSPDLPGQAVKEEVLESNENDTTSLSGEKEEELPRRNSRVFVPTPTTRTVPVPTFNTLRSPVSKISSSVLARSLSSSSSVSVEERQSSHTNNTRSYNDDNNNKRRFSEMEKDHYFSTRRRDVKSFNMERSSSYSRERDQRREWDNESTNNSYGGNRYSNYNNGRDDDGGQRHSNYKSSSSFRGRGGFSRRGRGRGGRHQHYSNRNNNYNNRNNNYNNRNNNYNNRNNYNNNRNNYNREERGYDERRPYNNNANNHRRRDSHNSRYNNNNSNYNNYNNYHDNNNNNYSNNNNNYYNNNNNSNYNDNNNNDNYNNYNNNKRYS